jgi:hypothetical protein
MGLLLGIEGSYGTNTGANIIAAIWYQASASGTLTSLPVYSQVSGLVKVALYTTAYDRVAVNNDGYAVSGGGVWYRVPVSVPCEIILGTYYCAGFIADTVGAVGRNSATGYNGEVYSSGTSYSAGMPDPLPTLSSTGFLYGIVGYGGSGGIPSALFGGGF